MHAIAAISACSRVLRAWLTGAALAAVLTVSITADVRGAFPGSNGRIAVVSSWLGCRGAGGIATIRPDGTGLRTVSRCGTTWSSAEWFADGRRLLAVDRTGPVVIRPDGRQRRRVNIRGAGLLWSASPSPDGRDFAYNLPTRSTDMSAPAEIWRARLDGKHARHIGDGWMPRWSPEGQRIAFASPNGLSVMDARPGGQVRLLVPGFQAHALDWSPDGSRLAFTDCCPYAVWTVPVDGSDAPPHRVFPREQHAGLILYGVVWSPDGKRLAFGRSDHDDELADYSIWTMTTRGTRLRKLRSSGFIDSEVNGEPALAWGPR